MRCGTQDMGSGTYTVLAQLAAEALGVPYAAVDVALGDTLLPEGPYSGGSMATASFTPAVEDAARRLRRDLIARAVADPRSPLHGQQPDQVSVEAASCAPATVRNRSLTWWPAQHRKASKPRPPPRRIPSRRKASTASAR